MVKDNYNIVWNYDVFLHTSFVFIKFLNDFQILPKDAHTHLPLHGGVIMTLVFHLEFRKQMLDFVKTVMILFLVCFFLCILDRTAVTLFHQWFIGAFNCHLIAIW